MLTSHPNLYLSAIVSHLQCVDSSSNTRCPLPLCLFECNCLSSASIVSDRARRFTSCLHCVLSSAIGRLQPPSQIEPERSLPTCSVSIRAQSLISHLDPGCSSSVTHLPPLPCPFKPERLSPTSTVSIRARTLVSNLDCVYSSSVARLRLDHLNSSANTSTGARFLPPPCPFECTRSPTPCPHHNPSRPPSLHTTTMPQRRRGEDVPPPPSSPTSR